MTVSGLAQSSFFDPAFVCPDIVQRGSLAWLLVSHPARVFPKTLEEAWERPGLPGRNPWPFRVVGAVTLLRFSEEGMSRRGAARRLYTDGAWRAAAGLSWRDPTPDESELRRFERFLGARDEASGVRRMVLWLAAIVDACQRHGVRGKESVWVADSTPMLCYGAILDTVRFLGDEARSLAVQWAKHRGTTVSELAKAWQLPLLTAKSTKGHFVGTDWSAPDDRANAVNEVAETAIAVVARIKPELARERRSGGWKRLARRCRNLVRKVEQDLEVDEEGRLVIARRVVEDRLVSRTDPEARHSRKSRKKTFNGFKLHVVGEAVSGLIAAVCVTKANTHDSAVAHRLIGRAKALCTDMERVLGDTHYGAVQLGILVQGTLDIELLGKPQALPAKKNDRFRKEDFAIDFDAMTVTCPGGITSGEWVWYRGRYGAQRAFRWAKASCQACPLRERCLPRTKSRRFLRLHAYERELRHQRARWSEPDVRATYRRRSEGERLIHRMTRHGCRKARAWGLQAAQIQAHVVAIVSNLKLLANVLGSTD